MVCGTDGRIIVTIIDVDTGLPLSVAGSEIEVTSDPYDGLGAPNYIDNGSDDDESDASVIELDNTCYDDGTNPPVQEFTVTLEELPAIAADCEIIDAEETQALPAQNVTVHVTLKVDCDDVGLDPSPTPTATATVGPAATINVASSNSNLGCGATSIVTITVRDSGGDPVQAGTIVNIVADKGNVSPASNQTTADGSAFVFYTAPSDAGGVATITAASGSALGATILNINCNVEPTQAPPPTTAPSTGIQPPNTGDAGLSPSNNSWLAYAGVALIVATMIGTMAVIRPRA